MLLCVFDDLSTVVNNICIIFNVRCDWNILPFWIRYYDNDGIIELSDRKDFI